MPHVRQLWFVVSVTWCSTWEVACDLTEGLASLLLSYWRTAGRGTRCGIVSWVFSFFLCSANAPTAPLQVSHRPLQFSVNIDHHCVTVTRCSLSVMRGGFTNLMSHYPCNWILHAQWYCSVLQYMLCKASCCLSTCNTYSNWLIDLKHVHSRINSNWLQEHLAM